MYKLSCIVDQVRAICHGVSACCVEDPEHLPDPAGYGGKLGEVGEAAPYDYYVSNGVAWTRLAIPREG